METSGLAQARLRRLMTAAGSPRLVIFI